ncbi:MAG: nucleotide-binding protein, partial [Saprospiraceae bacterium]|nr:nucleotide-binding protein [Saprospiraceae bacterium]
NKEWITTYFKWNLISTDPDDNKFSDCAIACNARYLVSDDKHFNVLKSLSFPRVSVLAAEEFVAILKETK